MTEVNLVSLNRTPEFGENIHQTFKQRKKRMGKQRATIERKWFEVGRIRAYFSNSLWGVKIGIVIFCLYSDK